MENRERETTVLSSNWAHVSFRLIVGKLPKHSALYYRCQVSLCVPHSFHLLGSRPFLTACHLPMFLRRRVEEMRSSRGTMLEHPGADRCVRISTEMMTLPISGKQRPGGENTEVFYHPTLLQSCDLFLLPMGRSERAERLPVKLGLTKWIQIVYNWRIATQPFQWHKR